MSVTNHKGLEFCYLIHILLVVVKVMAVLERAMWPMV